MNEYNIPDKKAAAVTPREKRVSFSSLAAQAAATNAAGAGSSKEKDTKADAVSNLISGFYWVLIFLDL